MEKNLCGEQNIPGRLKDSEMAPHVFGVCPFI